MKPIEQHIIWMPASIEEDFCTNLEGEQGLFKKKKKHCCEKYIKKGKRCKSCPGRLD